VRPLDYAALMSTESTQLELARIVDDLSRTLAMVEGGLASMLLETTSGAHETIHEEQEDAIQLDTGDTIVFDNSSKKIVAING
jgi:hypothetical protein